MIREIEGFKFDENIFGILIDTFSEAFTHTSLSIEKIFTNLEKYNIKLRSLLKDESLSFEKLPDDKKREVIDKYHFFITYMAYYKKMINELDPNNQKQINEIYEQYFKDFDTYMTRLLVFDENGINYNETGKKIEKELVHLGGIRDSRTKVEIEE